MQEIQNQIKDSLGNIIFDNSKIAMAFVDRDGKFIKANNELVKLLGYTEYELGKKTFSDITHPDDLHADLDLFKKTLLGEIDGYPMTKRYFTKDSKVVWAKLIVTGIKGMDNAVACFFSQVIPLDVDNFISKDQAEGVLYSPQGSDDSSVILSFFKKEWKWLLAFGITIIGGYVTWEVNNRISEFKTEQRFVAVEEDIEDLKKMSEEYKLESRQSFNELKEMIKGNK